MNDNEKLISSRLRQFSNAYARKDLAGALGAFTRTFDEIMVIGSGEREIGLGLDGVCEEFTREFAEWETLEFDLQWARLSIFENTAWVPLVSEMTKTGGGTQHIMTGRLTAILIKEANDWFIAHLHFSFPCEPFGNRGCEPSVLQRTDALRMSENALINS